MRSHRPRKLSLFGSTVFLLATPLAQAGPNLLLNPGFEAPSRSRPGEPVCWSYESFYGGVTANVKLTSKAHSGHGAVSIGAGSRYVGLKSAPFRVEPGRRYRVSVWVRIDTPESYIPHHPERSRFHGFCGDFTLKTFSARGAEDVIRQRNTTRLFLRYGPAGWRRYEHVVTTWPDAAYAVLYLRFNSGAHAFYIDDVIVGQARPIPTRTEFSKPEDFVEIRAEREAGYREDVSVGADGITLARPLNLAPNASFERDEDDNGMPDGWAVHTNGKDRSVALDQKPERVRDGKQSIKLTGGKYGCTELVSEPIAIELYDEYTLSVCYHFEGRGQPQFRLIGGDGQEHHQRDLFRRVAPYPWLREELRMRPGHWQGAPKKTVRVALRLYGQGALWFDGIVLRKGRDRGTVGEQESIARSGRLVSPIIEAGAVDAVKLSWEGKGAELFARVGPSDRWSPRTWSQWRGVRNRDEIFLPVRGVPMFMQWKAELRLGGDSAAQPVLRKVTIERVGEAPARREWIQVCRMHQGFIDPRDLPGGWKKYRGWRSEQIAERPEFVELAKDRAAGCRAEIDQMAQVRAAMYEQLVLYNAYLGAGPGLGGMELISQGTGTGCGDVNTKYGNALKNLGMQVRPMGMGALDGSGHSVLDVWSNEHNKWVFSDCFYGSCFITREGEPMSVEEVFDRWQQDRMDEVAFSTWGAPYTLMFRAEGHYTHGSQAPGPMRKRADSLLGEFESYNLVGSTIDEYGKAPVLSHRRDGFPLRRIHHYGSPTGRGVGRESIDFKINQTEIVLTALGRGKLGVALSHNMPSFDHFETRTDERAGWKASEADLAWPLAEGTNYLQARAVNTLGKAGPIAEVGLRYGPAFSTASARPPDPPKSTAWHFPHRWRVALDVNAGLYERENWEVCCALDLEAWAGRKVHPQSLRLVEAKTNEVPFSLLDGEIAFPLAGTSQILQQRRFCLYFDEKPMGEPPARAQPMKCGFPNWVPNGGFEDERPGFPFGTAPKGVEVKLVEGQAYEGQRCAVLCNSTGKNVSIWGPFFRIQPSTPVEVTFAARAPSKQGVIRVYLGPCDRDKRILPWNTNKVTAPLSLSSSGTEWRRGTKFGLTDPKAVWGRLRIDTDSPEVYLDDIIIRRRVVPEAGPVRVEVGSIEVNPRFTALRDGN